MPDEHLSSDLTNERGENLFKGGEVGSVGGWERRREGEEGREGGREMEMEMETRMGSSMMGGIEMMGMTRGWKRGDGDQDGGVNENFEANSRALIARLI
uniref:Uncharacterized protein n=1 Tax=Vespula pensylvanica TaxID=30213 RepID=A0A834NKJ4_VESPE|nr:hypothetical protein H0235_012683 [Vespula pensylvanica]